MQTEYDELLANFREPMLQRRRKIPYVLFGLQRQNFDAEGRMKPEPDLFCLDCSSSSGQIPIIQYYLGKGFKILKYWFPVNEKAQEVQKGQIAVEVDDKLGTGQYRALANFCQQTMDYDPEEIKKLKIEKSLLEERLAKEQEKNAKAEGKAGASRAAA